MEEEKITQWSNEKVQKDKQRSTKHIYKTKDRVARTPLKTGGELKCSGRVGKGQGNVSTLWNIWVTTDHGYVPLVVNTSRFFPHS
jgi:hypothetical protein